MKPIHVLFLLVLLPGFLSGQTNTDFWFAAPEVTAGHGDQPVYLRLTAFSQAATVIVSEPANTVANFPVIYVTIPANSTVSIDLTSLKSQVECKPPNTILNLGLHIHSDLPITAYYEVANNLNPEIFTLKGNNALGSSFYIPTQAVYDNEATFNPDAYNSFDIIASEDNTQVTINPKKPIVGHPAGTAFTVTLNKGQVYSAQATGQLGSDHLMGSVVTSDKPVSITVKDDSDQYPGQVCADLTGDQIVPVNIIGQDYIVVRGSTNSTVNDWVFVTATANNTAVSVNGSPVTTLSAGSTYQFNMTTGNLCSSVQTDKPVYLWHVTGYGCEAGSSLLPAMDCTGSTQVAFTRTTSYTFQLIILTKAGAQGSFAIDGNTTLVTAAMFSSVPGNPLYVYAKITFTAATLPVGAHMLTNSQDIFHMGIIHTYDAGQSGCAYGYFSDFASLNLGSDQSVCPGTPVTFDAGPNRISYQWYFNGTPYMTGVQNITVTAPGQYSVTVNDHGCILSDTVLLNNLPGPVPVISGITSFCQGASQPLTVTAAFSSYLWSTGATTQSITVSASGTYSVTVTGSNGCHGNTAAVVTVHPVPVVALAQPAPTCSNTPPFALTGGTPAGGSYSGPGVNSSTGMFDPSSGTGSHLITYSYTDPFGCSGVASKNLTVNAAPVVQLANQPAVCFSAPPFPLTGGTPAGGVYSGTGVNSATGMFTPSSGTGNHIITYTFTDANGCTGAAAKILLVYPLPVVQLAPLSGVCISAPPYPLTGGTPAGGIYSGTGVNSSTGYFNPASGTGPHNIIYTYTDANGCTNSAIQSLTVYALPAVLMVGQDGACITSPPFLLTCGSPAGGTYSGPGVNSSTGYFDPSSGAGPHTIDYTYTDIHGCTGTGSKILTVYAAPDVQFQPPAPVCMSVPPFLLTGGTPAGGIYSGTGVNSSTGYFDPASGTGQHTILYTYTDASECTGSAQAVLEVFQVPAVQLAAQAPVCMAVQPFLLSGGTPSGGTYSGPGVNSSTGYFDPSAGAGPHAITYTFTNASGCSAADVKNLEVYPQPVILLSGQDGTCISAPPFLLTCGSPAGGIYSGPGINPATGYFDPSSGIGPHTVTYTFTDGNGCTTAGTKTLTVYPLPVIQFSGQDETCISSPPFLLTCGTPAGGTYSGPGVNSLTGVFDPSSGTGPHTITYTYSDAFGCSGTGTKTLTVHPLPVVQFTAPSPVCTSAAPFPLTGGVPSGGTYSGSGVNSSTGYFDPASGPGNHVVTYSYTDVNGCTGNDAGTLAVNPLPVVQLADQPQVCSSAPSFQLSGGMPSGGLYSGPGVNSSTGSFDPASGAGTHPILYSFTDPNGCANSAVKPLTVHAIPVVQVSGQNSACISAPPFLLTGGTPPGGLYSGPGVNTATSYFDPSSGAGVHTITYTYSDANSCTGSASAGLTVIPMPLPAGTVTGPAGVCESSQNVQYNLGGADPLATSFTWEINPASAGTITGNGATPVVSFSTGFTGNAGIRFQPESGCGTGAFSPFTAIAVHPAPAVTLQPCIDPVTTRGAKPFRLRGGNPPGGVYSVDGTLLPAGILDPATLAASPPDHVISYSYTNSYNCSAGMTMNLTVAGASGFVCRTMLTDIRDQKTYPTFEVVSGTVHRCWMAANLNYGSFVQDHDVQTDNCSVEKYCPGNDVSQCSLSGGLYQWDELMTYLPADNAVTEGRQGLCPPEWHVAAESDWQELISTLQGPGTAGWILLDPVLQNGFHARTSGVLYQNDSRSFMPPFFSATIFWTSTSDLSGSTRIFTHGLNDTSPSISTYRSGRNNAFPVRCVRDW